MSKYKCFDGYCPEQGSYETIEIYYAQIPMLGREPGYKKTDFECSYNDEHYCEFASSNRFLSI